MLPLLLMLLLRVSSARPAWRAANFDREPCVFDPRGRVLQLEYAEIASSRGDTALGALAKDAVLLCSRSTKEGKLAVVDSRHAATYAGLRADGIALVDIARLRAAQERVSSPEMPPSPRALALAVADAAHECARGGGKRAYGARLLLAGFGDDGHPELWSIGPGGDARFHQSIVAVGKDAHRVEKTSWEDYDAPTAAARAVATVIAAASPEEEEDFSVQMVILAKRRDDEENRAGLLAWQCSFKRDDLVWEGDVPRLTAPLEASLREALDL